MDNSVKKYKSLLEKLLPFTLLLLIVLVIFTGSYKIPPGQIIQAAIAKFTGADFDEGKLITLWEIRLPRILAAAIAGATLSSTGAVYQGIFRNPLIDPYIMGVSAGAAFGAALSIVLNIRIIDYRFTALVFAFIASSISYMLAFRRKRTSIIGMILAGIVINSFFSSGIAFLKAIAEVGQLKELTFWLMGGIYSCTWNSVFWMTISFIPCFILLKSIGGKIDIITQGEDIAQTSGVNVQKTRLIGIVAVTISIAFCISYTGIIGWVGLGVPHFVRTIFGVSHKKLITNSAFAGAILLLLCDTFSRNMMNYINNLGELPISVITSFIGAIFLITIIRGNNIQL